MNKRISDTKVHEWLDTRRTEQRSFDDERSLLSSIAICVNVKEPIDQRIQDN
jgi:hypothetical protein